MHATYLLEPCRLSEEPAVFLLAANPYSKLGVHRQICFYNQLLVGGGFEYEIQKIEL